MANSISHQPKAVMTAAAGYPQCVASRKRAVGWIRESIRNLIANPPKF